MYIKTWHIKLKPDQGEAFLELQKEIDAFYRKYVNYEIEFLQDGKDPDRWVEIQYYASKQDYLDGQEKINRQEPIRPFWHKFHEMLDSHDDITEEEFEDHS